MVGCITIHFPLTTTTICFLHTLGMITTTLLIIGVATGVAAGIVAGVTVGVMVGIMAGVIMADGTMAGGTTEDMAISIMTDTMVSMAFMVDITAVEDTMLVAGTTAVVADTTVVAADIMVVADTTAADIANVYGGIQRKGA